MGSPLGPALANIFVDYKAKLFNIAKRLLVYFHYVDETFVVFNNEEDCNTFLTPTTFTPHYSSPTKRNPITLSLPGRVGRKAQFGISNLRVQETHLQWQLSMLELLQPPKTKNQPNWYSCSQSFYNPFKKQTGPRAWQNSFKSN